MMQTSTPDPARAKTPTPWPRWLKLIAWFSPFIAASVIGNWFIEGPGFVVATLCLAGIIPVLLVSGTLRLVLRMSRGHGPTLFRFFCANIGYGALFWLASTDREITKAARTWTTECVLLLVLIWIGLVALALFPKWFFSRRGLARMFFAGACLATAPALFYAEENWRGHRAWDRFLADWKAKGVSFDFASLVGPPMPEEQNVAMHPLFKPLQDYTLPTSGPLRGNVVWRDTNAATRLHSLTILPRELVVLAKGQWPWPTTVQSRTNGVALRRMADWREFYRRDTNFASTPRAALAAEDVLLYLERHAALLADLDDALRRPRSLFPIRMAEARPLQTLQPHLASLKNMSSVLALRSQARLEAGQTDEALRDVERLFGLNRMLDEERLLLSQLVQIAMQAITLGAVAHGTADHRWEEKHLTRLEELLRPVNKFADLERSLRGEVAFAAENATRMQGDRRQLEESYLEFVEQNARFASLRRDWSDFDKRIGPRAAGMVIRHAPTGWFDEYAVQVLSGLLSSVDARFIDADRQLISMARRPSPGPALRVQRWLPFPPEPTTRASSQAAFKAARLQTGFHQARIACALERNWLRHRAFPERLDALVPEFLVRIPHDVFDGQPMRYRREGEQGFVLWSIGFDGKDDNAAPLVGTDEHGVEAGDLVWRYPAK